MHGRDKLKGSADSVCEGLELKLVFCRVADFAFPSVESLGCGDPCGCGEVGLYGSGGYGLGAVRRGAVHCH